MRPPQFPQAIRLDTRTGWPIPNEARLERPPVALLASAQLWQQLRPHASLRSLTATYNCVGLIVASRWVWVDPEHLLRVLQEDGFRQLDRDLLADVGDVVVYEDEAGELCHVGIVIRKNLLLPGQQQDPFQVLSKWGADGEYLHDMSDVPDLLGKPKQFWTDRKEA